VFRTVLVANRGEIARRVFRACRGLGIRTVAVFSEPDRGSPHVRDADEAQPIGGHAARDSYLNGAAILDAARRAKVDAVHPGYGFLSENAEFADACARAGFVFVGPPAEAIRAMGDKTRGRRLMRAAGVPVLAGSEDAVTDLGDARRLAETIGFPVMLKAAAGGGGIGMVRAESAAELQRAFTASSRRAHAAFGSGALYVERCLDRPRHVEVQVVGDAHGNLVHLHERECSVQRRHQKLVEESPAPNLPVDAKVDLLAAAIAGARAIGYVNAGTLEFLVDASGHFYFLEMNTRLQVEHPVTEEVTGVDVVAAQFEVAAGSALPWRQGDIVPRGAAVECRVYAEDPAKRFLPSAGTIVRFEPPGGAGIRVESGIETGTEVTVHYDPLLLKVIAVGTTRAEAIDRLAVALGCCVVEGVRTTLPFLARVLANEQFRRGAVDTQMVERGAFDA
jgi:acetyl-CoA carboxylase biotin carboxylase subunit